MYINWSEEGTTENVSINCSEEGTVGNVSVKWSEEGTVGNVSINWSEEGKVPQKTCQLTTSMVGGCVVGEDRQRRRDGQQGPC